MSSPRRPIPPPARPPPPAPRTARDGATSRRRVIIGATIVWCAFGRVASGRHPSSPCAKQAAHLESVRQRPASDPPVVSVVKVTTRNEQPDGDPDGGRFQPCSPPSIYARTNGPSRRFAWTRLLSARRSISRRDRRARPRPRRYVQSRGFVAPRLARRSTAAAELASWLKEGSRKLWDGGAVTATSSDQKVAAFGNMATRSSTAAESRPRD